MMGSTHMVLAAALYFSLKIVGIRTPIDYSFLVLLLGSVFPDIDHPRGFLSSHVFLLKGVSRIVSEFTEHRGIMHSLLGSAGWSLLVLFVNSYFSLGDLIAFAFWSGYVIHLLGDSLTPAGVRWLQPFSKRKMRGRLLTGSSVEKALSLLLSLAAGLLFIYG